MSLIKLTKVKFKNLPLLLLFVLAGCAQSQNSPYMSMANVSLGMEKSHLEKIGFSDDNLVDYSCEGDVEFITYADTSTPMEGDIITFYIVKGKVKEWYKGECSWAVERLNKVRKRR